jgi:hypothetical protein
MRDYRGKPAEIGHAAVRAFGGPIGGIGVSDAGSPVWHQAMDRPLPKDSIRLLPIGAAPENSFGRSLAPCRQGYSYLRGRTVTDRSRSVDQYHRAKCPSPAQSLHNRDGSRSGPQDADLLPGTNPAKPVLPARRPGRCRLSKSIVRVSPLDFVDSAKRHKAWTERLK